MAKKVNSNLLFSIVLVVINLVVGQAVRCYADADTAVDTAKNQDKLLPDHQIQYKETLSPEWKVNWDLARSLYREKKYPEALVQYEILFTQKGNVDEARWEYASILMYLKRWESAKGELEKLLATEPESIRYCLAMAAVSLETGNIDNSINLYEKLLGQPASDSEKFIILKGLIKAYEILEQKGDVVVFLEQLIALNPQDVDLQIKQVDLELQSGNFDKAKLLCSKLEQSWPQDINVMILCARVEEGLNKNKDAISYWQKVIALDPDNAEAHDRLYNLYYENESWAKSFSQLEYLLKMTPTDVTLLGRAADLNMHLGRVDHALQYYEFGLTVDPFNTDLAEGKKKAQKIMAEDLLVLVKNDGGKKLWQDLFLVTPDSPGVYREVAKLLREQGQVDKLIEVLRILNRHAPDDQQIYDELAFLLEKQGYVDELSALQASRSSLDKP